MKISKEELLKKVNESGAEESVIISLLEDIEDSMNIVEDHSEELEAAKAEIEAAKAETEEIKTQLAEITQKYKDRFLGKIENEPVPDDGTKDDEVKDIFE